MLAEREQLCESWALRDSARLADIDRLLLCERDALKDPARLPERDRLRDCDRLCDPDMLMLSDRLTDRRLTLVDCDSSRDWLALLDLLRTMLSLRLRLMLCDLDCEVEAYWLLDCDMLCDRLCERLRAFEMRLTERDLLMDIDCEADWLIERCSLIRLIERE